MTIAALSSARSAAEVLEARQIANFAYNLAKRTARLAEAKNAHDGNNCSSLAMFAAMRRYPFPSK